MKKDWYDSEMLWRIMDAVAVLILVFLMAKCAI
jgi:hypothetical protein